MKVVPCIAWVRRGVAALVPQKVKLSKDDAKKLLQGASAVTEDSSDCEPDQNDDADIDPDKRYGLDKYDENEEPSEEGNHLKGLAVFATNEDDPFIANHDSDDEDEDFKLRPDDNLLLIGRVVDEDFNLEVHVYNESGDTFYVHHDYPLECPPICIEAIHYDPGSERGGNLCALGSLSSAIQIWDLDIVESLEPIGILGNADGERKVKKKGKKASDNHGGETSAEPKKKKNKTITHTEAVLDLAWNRQKHHILASGSADQKVILWDLETAEGSNILSNHNDKVQALRWHPVEDNLLLSGGCDGLINLWDCRQCTSQRQWSVSSGEIEKIHWNTWDPFRYLATTDTGDIYSVDTRQDAIRTEDRVEKAHKDAISGLSLHSTTKDCLATCGVDGVVKIWRVQSGGETPLQLVTKRKLKLGKLFCCQFCPDNPWLLAVGGESEDGIYLWDIRRDEKFASEFGIQQADSREPAATAGDDVQDNEIEVMP